MSVFVRMSRLSVGTSWTTIPPRFCDWVVGISSRVTLPPNLSKLNLITLLSPPVSSASAASRARPISLTTSSVSWRDVPASICKLAYNLSASGAEKKVKFNRPPATRPRLNMNNATATETVTYRHWIVTWSARLNDPSLNLSKRALKRCCHGVNLLALAWKARRKCPGKTRKHSIKLAIIIAITTSGMPLMMSPITSEIISRGVKAAIVVNEDDNTGAAIRLAPRVAASSASSPFRNCISACSPTTMASSTTMPSAIIIPNKLTILIDCPLISITPTVAIIATGIPIAIQMATGTLKNKNRMIITSKRPVRPFFSSKEIRLRIRSDCTSKFSMDRFLGTEGLNLFTYEATISDTSSASADNARWMWSSTAALPLRSRVGWSWSKFSLISAISCK